MDTIYWIIFAAFIGGFVSSRWTRLCKTINGMRPLGVRRDVWRAYPWN